MFQRKVHHSRLRIVRVEIDNHQNYIRQIVRRLAIRDQLIVLDAMEQKAYGPVCSASFWRRIAFTFAMSGRKLPD